MFNFNDRLKYLEARYISITNEGPALHQAVIRNDLDVLELFIECKADINIVDAHGRLPIAYVKEEKQLKVLDLLLAAGSNIYQLDEFGKMQFSTAFRSGHANVIEKYLKYKLNLNMTDSNGQTAIHYLMDNSCNDIEYDLKVLNYNVDVEDLNGQTPMLLAIKNENLDWVKLLLEKSSNVNYIFERQSTPIYGLIRYFCDGSSTQELSQQYSRFTIQCFELLIAKGAEVNSIFYGSYTILKLAVEFLDFGIVTKLLKKLAVVETSGSSIIELNRITIEQFPDAKSYYSELIAELKRMMELKLYPKVSFFNILFEENINTLAKYFQSLKFQRDFEKNSSYLTFPNYCEILRDKYMKGVTRKYQILKIQEKLSEIFYLYFPPHVIKKIATCYFSDFHEEPDFEYYTR